MAAISISSPVPVAWHTTLAVGLVLTASFFMCLGFCWILVYSTSYEATSSRRSRSFAKEITAAVASVFLGFGSLFVFLAGGVYV